MQRTFKSPGSSSVDNGQGSLYLETQLASIAKTMQDMSSAMQALSQKRGPTDKGGDEEGALCFTAV